MQLNQLLDVDLLQDMIAGFLVRHAMIRSRIMKQHKEIFYTGITREEYARLAQNYPDWDFMFMLFDKDIEFAEKIWKTLNPSYVKRQKKKADKPRKKKLSVRQRREAALAQG